MWTPDLRLQASPGLSALILALHGLAALALVQMGGGWLWWIPLVLISGILHLFQTGLKRLPGSVQRVWLGPLGWHLQRRNGQQRGPFLLGSASRIDTRFIRLSLHHQGGMLARLWPAHHLILTPAMIGNDDFRRLQVFLRWSPEKNQAPLS
ncbi:MAG TPA: protein YgfX [Candidatus Kapabacteria bacterium]|nr:protein YgfX [Candidatus Kapabacteria bacterium]